MKMDSHSSEADRIENVRQQKKESMHVLHSTIKPHENHILFEHDTKKNELRLAVFESESKDISWSKAVAKDFTRKSKVIKKPFCIYISALNRDNAVKILHRDYSIIVK